MIIEVQRRDHVQRMTYEEFEQRIREGELSAETRVRFEVVTGDAFRPVGELELYQTLADPAALQFRRNLTTTGVPIVTALLVGFQIRVYLSSWAPGAERWLQENLTNWAPAILEHGEVYRLLTYGLLHVSFTHLLFNLLFLAYTGWNLERAIGRANLLLLYFGSVFTGGLLSMTMAPDRPSLGASGGDFGLLAAVVVFGWKHWDSIPERSRKYFGYALVPYLGFSILTGLNAENVDNWGHLGGLIGGIILMTILEPDVLPGRAAANRFRRRLSVGLLALVAGLLVAYGPRLIPLEPHGGQGWEVQRPSYWRTGWTFTGDRGWFAPTGKATLVAETTTEDRPRTAAEAADTLIRRIGSGGTNPEVLSREPTEVGGWDAERLRIAFELQGERQLISALVLARGVFSHRVQFQALADQSDRYAPLFERIEDSVILYESEALELARSQAQMHPRSWEPAARLGLELYRAGEPKGALRAYERALSVAPAEPRAWEGMLRVYADYHLDGGAETAERALQVAGTEPKVVVAAAEALSAAGKRSVGVDALNAAWAERPGDFTLRNARLKWGLQVDLEPVVEGEFPAAAP